MKTKPLKDKDLYKAQLTQILETKKRLSDQPGIHQYIGYRMRVLNEIFNIKDTGKWMGTLLES